MERAMGVQAQQQGGQSQNQNAYQPAGNFPQQLAAHQALINEVAQSSGLPAGLWAAGILAESEGRADAVNPSSGATGLLQALPLAGRGGTHPVERLKDPRFNLELAVPEFQRAYARAVQEGWQGPELWGATLAYAQRYENYADRQGRYAPQTPSNQHFMRRIREVWDQDFDGQLPNTAGPNPVRVDPQAGGIGYLQEIQAVSQNAPRNYDSAADYQRWYLAACSAASLAAVLRGRGQNVSVSGVINAIPRGGITPESGLMGHDYLIQAARNLGAQGFSISSSRENIMAEISRGRPVIIDIRDRRFPEGHFITITGADQNGVKVVDSSAANLSQLSWQELLASNRYSGKSIVIQ
jgi:hypothetical protein